MRCTFLNLEAQPTKNIEAYLAFAEAERFRYSGNFFELEKSLPLYEKAIELDPEFTDPQVGYLSTVRYHSFFGQCLFHGSLQRFDCVKASFIKIG